MSFFIRLLVWNLYYIFLCCFLCFVSCSSKINTFDSNSKNTSYIYGIGNGKDINSAKENAIKDLVSNLQVSIKMQTQNTTTHNNYSLESSGMQYAFLESGFKDLSGIELEKVKKDGDLVIAHVRASKSVLQSQISQRAKTKLDFIEANIEKCGYPSFKSYEKFKNSFQEFQNDINVIATLGGNISFNLEAKDYGAIAARKPRYNLDIEHSSYSSDVSPILLAELSKFIAISKEATSTIHVKITNDKYIGLELMFIDCNGDVEDSININSYIESYKLKSNNNKTRLGAVIYKTLSSFVSSS